MATTLEVAKEVNQYFSFGSSRGGKAQWANLWWESGLKTAGLNSAEFAEFKEACAVTGIPASEQLATFSKMLKMIESYGDTGYGDKPDDMSRIAYWFQHVAPEQAASAASKDVDADVVVPKEVYGMY